MTTVKLQFRAENLDKLDFFGLGKSDPYLTIEQKTGDNEFQRIYRTEFIKRESSPTWKPFHLNFEEENPELKIQVFDRDKTSQDELIGGFETKLNELLDRSEVKFECVNENKKGKSKVAGTVFLMYGKRAVGLKMVFRANPLSSIPQNLSLSLSERFLKGKKKEKLISETEIIKASSKEAGEWKLIETAAEDIENLLHIQVFKHYQVRGQVSEPVLKGEFFMELKKLTETTFSDVSFDLYKKEEKTGTISLITCKVNLPPPAVPSKVIETAGLPKQVAPPPPPPQVTTLAPPSPKATPPPPPPPPQATPLAPPPPQVAPPPPPPPPPMAPPLPGPPMASKQEQSKASANIQDRPKNANPPPKAMKRERSMLDEIKEFQQKKKLKSVSMREKPVPRPPTENVASKPSMNVLDIMKNVEGFEMAEDVEKDEKDDTGEWSE